MRIGRIATKPKLHTEMLVRSNPEMADALKQIDKLHGAAMVVQTAEGGFAGIRLNRTTGRFEYASEDGRTWAEVGGPAGAAAESDGDLRGSFSRLVTENVQYAGNVQVGAVDVGAIPSTYLALSGGAMTGAITTNSTFDGVDVSAHDHSDSTNQTRLAKRDRWRALTLFNQCNHVLGVNPIYFGGYDSGTGYRWPTAVHIHRVQVMALVSNVTASDPDPQPQIVLRLFKNAASLQVIELATTDYAAGWYRAFENINDPTGEGFAITDEICAMVETDETGADWSQISAVLDYTID